MSIEERISHRIPAPLLDAIRASSLFLVACVARAAKGFRHFCLQYLNDFA